jgi:hypothetical protein
MITLVLPEAVRLDYEQNLRAQALTKQTRDRQILHGDGTLEIHPTPTNTPNTPGKPPFSPSASCR